ncbi:hypothetical protein LAD67_18305 [Escherichia coli]|nr:hypothetical protein [Escherichia coli]
MVAENRSPPRRLFDEILRFCGESSRRFFLGRVTTFLQAAETGEYYGRRFGGRLSARAKTTWQADASEGGTRATLGASALYLLPVCDVSDSGVFLSYVMELFPDVVASFICLL